MARHTNHGPYISGYASLGLPSNVVSQNPSSSSKREKGYTIQVAFKPRTGRFFASAGSNHVWSGSSLEDLATQMARAKDINFRIANFVPGEVYVRVKGGKAKIEGSKPALDQEYELTGGYFSSTLEDARMRIKREEANKRNVVGSYTAEQFERSREINLQLLAKNRTKEKQSRWSSY
ncbi:MAG: hypothetical protein AABY10_00315 [Nanoarchaeota archaeon]